MLWDPFGAIADSLKNGYEQFIIWLEWFLLNPLPIDESPMAVMLGGNALGTAPFLALAIFVVLSTLAIFAARFRIGFVRSLLTVLLMIVLAPLWYNLIGYLKDAGDGLTVAVIELFATLTNTGTEDIFQMFSVGDAFWGAALFGIAVFHGIGLLFLFTAYEWVSVLVAFLGLITLALVPLGERARKALNALIAIGLVTMVFGKPIAVLSLEIGQSLGNVFDGSPSEISAFAITTVGSLIIAFWSQLLLGFLMYRGVSNVAGRVNAAISGKVDALNKGVVQQSKSPAQMNIRSIKHRSETMTRLRDYGGGVKDAAVAAGTAKAAAALAARAAASTTPIGAGATIAGSVAISQASKLVKSRQRKTEGR